MTITFVFDQTLINEAGVGFRAMNRAFAELFAVENAFAAVEFTGRTNGAIFRDCFRNHGMLDDGYRERAERFRQRYIEVLAEELQRGAGFLLPGVEALLQKLSVREEVRLGLGTGKYREAARLKLQTHGVWQYFRDGGFADDSEDRAEVIAAAIARLRRDEPGPAELIYVVGDSPLDIAAVHANAVAAVAVATGASGSHALVAAGADFVFDDLSDHEQFARLLLGEKAAG